MSTKKKKILISVFMGMTYRNLVLSGLLAKLSEEFEIHLIGSAENPDLVKKLRATGFPIRYISGIRPGTFRIKIYSMLELAQYRGFFLHRPTATMRKYVARSKELGGAKNWIASTIARVANCFKPQRFYSAIYRAFLPASFRLGKKEFDAVLLMSTDILYDKLLALTANQAGLPLLVSCHSWDNLPARGFIIGKPQRLLVWNKTMETQASRLHELGEAAFSIGVPQFDRYLEIADQLQRKELTELLGVNESERFVTYTCSAERVFPDEAIFIEKLNFFLSGHGLKLLLRLHPTERLEDYSQRFGGENNIILNRPSGEFAASSQSQISTDPNSMAVFVGIMKFSEVVLNMASTTALDAILFNTPVVCVAFNLEESLKNAWNRAENWYVSDHFSAIAGSGAVKLARSWSDLEGAILAYVGDRGLDSNERNQLLRDFDPYPRGTAARVKEALYQAISK